METSQHRRNVGEQVHSVEPRQNELARVEQFEDILNHERGLTFGPDNDGEQKADSTGVVGDTARTVEAVGERGDIRVFEEGLESSRSTHSDDRERNR